MKRNRVPHLLSEHIQSPSFTLILFAILLVDTPLFVSNSTDEEKYQTFLIKGTENFIKMADKEEKNYTLLEKDPKRIKQLKLYLEANRLYDKRRLITKQENGEYSIPVILDHTKDKDDSHSTEISDLKSPSIDPKSESIDPKSPNIDPETLLKDHPQLASCRLVVDEATVSTRKQPSDIEVFLETVHKILKDTDHLLNQEDKELLPSFLSQLPSIKIQRHSDLVLLSKGGSTHQLWNRLQSIYPPLWTQ
uniref:Uncharacterized protein n=1 Tax=Amphimedon queenslandica TaxID=400682 RepID=A0A1X7SG84_AMPQE